MLITKSLTMANIKPEDTDNSIWQGYPLQVPHPVSSHSRYPIYDTNYSNGLRTTAPYHERHHDSYQSLDVPSMQAKIPLRDAAGVLSGLPPTLDSHNSFPSLKRGFPSTEESSYRELVQDFGDETVDAAKPSINQDHRLLSFRKLAEKHAIIDDHGRLQSLELVAQIHGMFFLAEMSSAGGEGLLVQSELTCYRRNLFQISGTVTVPRGALNVMTERGEKVPIVSLEVAIMASESVDGLPVKLIVIPWKTPPANSPEIEHGQDLEPVPIPLLPVDDGSKNAHDGSSMYPIAYRRLQFRIATANNGRRRELQQHFTLHLDVIATLAGGSKIKVCETSTAPIVVRGRSPRNFQTRKEIPLAGSSSSRGGLPDLHTSTSVGSGNAPVSAPAGKSKGLKPHGLEVPRSAFTFDSNNHLPSSPSLQRTSTLPNYLESEVYHSEQRTGSHTSNLSPVAIDYLQVSQQNPASAHSQPPPNPTLNIEGDRRQHYGLRPPPVSPLAPPIRLVDSNPRPTKSPRHTAPPELPSASSYGEHSLQFAPLYPETNEIVQQRDIGYFPAAAQLQSWSTTAPTRMYETVMPQTQNLKSQHYQFPNESYDKENPI